MARDRAGYPRSYTRNDVLADRFYADRELMAHVAAFTLDGRPFGELPVRVRGPSAHETRFAPKDTEFEIAARALVRLGERTAAFTADERPDWRVRLADGRTIGLEVSEVNPSAGFANRVEDLRIALREAIDADPTLPIAGRFLNFHFGPRAFAGAPIERVPLPAGVRRALLRELLAYLRAGTFTAGRVTGPAYPTLEGYDITVYVGEAQPAYVNFDIGATSFAPLGAFQAAMHRATKKAALARDYYFPHALWLVLGITDQLGVFTESVAAFGRLQLRGGPFERVIISDGQVVRLLERAA